MGNQKIISIAVCTYNREKHIINALESLKNQSLNLNLYEIIIVDNNSTDNTPELVTNFINANPDINLRYFKEDQQGLSFARNRAITESISNIIAFIDDDAIVPENYLMNIKEFSDTHQNIDAFGGKVIPIYENGSEPKFMSRPIWGLVTKIDYGDKIREFPKNKYPVGCNMIIKREVLLNIGLFDTNLGRIGRIGLASEEKDLFERIKKNGGKIYYSPNIIVYHNIDNYRLEFDYIKKLSFGIGLSEKIRTNHIGFIELAKKFIEYIFKFIIAFIFALYFLINLEFKKAKYIILIRYFILLGFFKDKNN